VTELAGALAGDFFAATLVDFTGALAGDGVDEAIVSLPLNNPDDDDDDGVLVVVLADDAAAAGVFEGATAAVVKGVNTFLAARASNTRLHTLVA
jgi:hypothetical protein